MSRYNEVGKVATSVSTSNGYTRVTYHSTCVVAFDDSEIYLDSGGWRTATTKVRMNQAANQYDLGFHVYQERGNWYVSIRKNGDWAQFSKVNFFDGMRLPRN